MVYPRRVLHLTVSPEGEIDSWDDHDRAMRAKPAGHEYVMILLSLSQTEKLKKAQQTAKSRSKKTGG
jgi:hypothetical protein